MDAGRPRVEGHALVVEATHRKREAENQQEVADDRADEGRLQNRDVAGGDEEEADDELGQVA